MITEVWDWAVKPVRRLIKYSKQEIWVYLDLMSVNFFFIAVVGRGREY